MIVAKITRKWVTAFALLLMTPLAYSMDADLQKCGEAESHADERVCLESLAHRTKARLVKLEKEALERLDSWDQEEVYRTHTRTLLLDSNREFRQHRRAQCALFQSLAAGGDGAGDMELDCEIELTKQRIQQIKEIADALKRR